jgi:dipeptidyl aminopeptidase/acylaminoacyl peptidase
MEFLTRFRSNKFDLLFVSLSSAILTEVKHVDGQTIVIIGKGVGGYLATMALARDEERLFKCGIIVSPTIDWYRQGMN